MNIIVLSKAEAKDFWLYEPWAAISIAPHLGTHPQIPTDNRVGLFRATFGDVEKDTDPRWFHKFGYPITPQDAEQIWWFIQDRVSRIKTLMVHCEAGVSRSPAVAAAVCKEYGLDGEKYFHSPYCINKTVYETMLASPARSGRRETKTNSDAHVDSGI